MKKLLNTPLDNFYKWEKKKPSKEFLIQPIHGIYNKYSWERVGQEARKMCSYIHSLNLPKKSKIAILSKNCAHWIIADLAIMMSENISVPIYANVKGKTAKYILEHSESKLLFIGKLEDSDWIEIKDNIPKEIVKVDFGHYDLNSSFQKWDDIILNQNAIEDDPAINIDDIITIIYTSGTTGTPKGVVLTYKSVVIATKNLNHLVPLKEDDRFISYLPLSHIAERALVEQGGISSGGKIFFVESLETFAKNLKFSKPTIFFGVPRIYTKFMTKIISIFSQKAIDIIMKIPIINNLFSALIRKSLGLNNSRICVTGAASIPVTTLEWFNKFKIKIYEAYGMSENAACSHGNYPNNIKFGTVGKAMPNTDVKITEKGEIIMKNECIMKGYYKEKELTNETIKNGYLYTGDKGKIDDDGYLTITGRIKDIFKTSKGKYVVPNPIEMKFSKNKNIEQICVVGINLVQPIGLVVLSDSAIEKNKSNLKLSLSNTLEEINKQIDSHEKIEKIIIVKDQWTTENDILTPTMKIKRNKIDELYESDYIKWYESSEKIIWE